MHSASHAATHHAHHDVHHEGQDTHHQARDEGHGTHHATRAGASLSRVALSATVHCLLGCAIGEVAGMVIGTALGWSNGATIAFAVVLAFASGYAMTMIPLLRSGLPTGQAARLALAADSASIAIMEVADNLVMLLIPGAMDAGLDTPLFWLSLAGALLVAGVAAFPVNRWLISRGRGHGLVHAHH